MRQPQLHEEKERKHLQLHMTRDNVVCDSFASHLCHVAFLFLSHFLFSIFQTSLLIPLSSKCQKILPELV